MVDEKAIRKFQKELNSGAISLVLLSILKQQGEPMYGYEIAQFLKAQCGDSLPMNQGAIYPVLRAMQRRGLTSSHQVPSASGPPRKYYQITASGLETLRQYRLAWESTMQFVNSFLDNSEDQKHGNKQRSSGSRKVPKRT